MSKYITRQRKILLDFLSGHTDEDMTPRQIALALAKDGISTSAVYRNLASLEDDGQVRRTAPQNSRDTYYRYIGADVCKEALHLSCIKCKKTYHMSVAGANTLAKDLVQNENFEIDKTTTVLYGLCKTCQSGQSKKIE